MKRLHCFAPWSVLAMLVVSTLGSPARAQTGLRIVGALSNFDCYNDTQSDCSGFEIEIEGIHKEDVVHTWNFSAFGGPTVTDGGTPGAPSALVRYHSDTAVVHPGGVTHFGVTLSYYTAPGSILRRWLPSPTVAVPNPPPVPYVLPSHQSQLVLLGGVNSVHNSITNDTPDGVTILWVLPFGNRVHRGVDLEELMPNNAIVQNAVPMGGGPSHLNPARLDPGVTWTSDDPPGADDAASGILWYEVYEDVVITQPHGRDIHQPGRLIGRVMDATITTISATTPYSVTLSDTAVYGTQDVIGRVTLSGAVSQSGTVVNLVSDSPSATVPATVTVPANQVSVLFTIHTQAVASLSNVTITASTGGVSRGASFAIKPPDLYQLWLSFVSIGGGTNVDGITYLTSPAPPGGVTVQLTSSSPAAEIPATVTVPAGATTVPFTVRTHPVATPTSVTFTATYNGLSKTATLMVAPDGVQVSGQIGLQGCVNLAQPLTFEFRPTDGTAAFTQTTTLNSDGTFTLINVPSKRYNLAIKGAKWLRKVVTVDTSGGAVTGVTATLLAGDVSNHNAVTTSDYLQLKAAFGAHPGDPNWNPGADLNCDGVVSTADYLLLKANFGQQGDP